MQAEEEDADLKDVLDRPMPQASDGTSMAAGATSQAAARAADKSDRPAGKSETRRLRKSKLARKQRYKNKRQFKVLCDQGERLGAHVNLLRFRALHSTELARSEMVRRLTHSLAPERAEELLRWLEGAMASGELGVAQASYAAHEEHRARLDMEGGEALSQPPLRAARMVDGDDDDDDDDKEEEEVEEVEEEMVSPPSALPPMPCGESSQPILCTFQPAAGSSSCFAAVAKQLTLPIHPLLQPITSERESNEVVRRLTQSLVAKQAEEQLRWPKSDGESDEKAAVKGEAVKEGPKEMEAAATESVVIVKPEVMMRDDGQEMEVVEEEDAESDEVAEEEVMEGDDNYNLPLVAPPALPAHVTPVHSPPADTVAANVASAKLAPADAALAYTAPAHSAPADAAPARAAAVASVEPLRRGQRVRVTWKRPAVAYDGLVIETAWELERKDRRVFAFRVHYDDGDENWHNFCDRDWTDIEILDDGDEAPLAMTSSLCGLPPASPVSSAGKPTLRKRSRP